MPVASDSPLRVCYFGTYRGEYNRNQMMISGLRMNDVAVIECHQSLWHGIEDRVRIVSGGWLKPSFWWRLLSVYWRVIKAYMKVGEYDVLVVGYPGQFDIFLARLLSWLNRKPLVWDVFMSLYLITIERGLDKQNLLSAKFLHLIEGKALKLADLLILDTKEYVEWFCENYGVRAERFRLVPTGADERIFFPTQQNPSRDGKFIVFYSGTFIPNHGIKYMIEAARLLTNEIAIQFEFVGEGPELDKAKQFVLANQLPNVTFIGWLEKDQLKLRMNQADVCLGAFGTTPQSMMTVQNKIYEAAAMRRPLISGDSLAVRQVFTHGENIFLCERANSQALADAIITLYKDGTLRQKIAQNGYNLFIQNYSLSMNGKRFRNYLLEIAR